MKIEGQKKRDDLLYPLPDYNLAKSREPVIFKVPTKSEALKDSVAEMIRQGVIDLEVKKDLKQLGTE